MIMIEIYRKASQAIITILQNELDIALFPKVKSKQFRLKPLQLSKN